MTEHSTSSRTEENPSNIVLGDASVEERGVPLSYLLDKKIVNIPSQSEKAGHVLSTDGTNLRWIKANSLHQDTQLRTSAFTAQTNTCYTVGWGAANYVITLPAEGLMNGDQIRFQNLDQSFTDANKKASITPAVGHSINAGSGPLYLQEAGIDVLLTYYAGNWAADQGGTSQQNTNNLISASIYWKFTTQVGGSTYTLPAPALPHADKELYAVNYDGAELLASQFSIDQAKNQLTLSAVPTAVQSVKVRCWLKHKDASTTSDNAFPLGYTGLFEPTYSPSPTHWKEHPAGDVLCIATTTNFPRFGGTRGVTRLQDGRIAVIGGHDWENGYTNECYLGTIDENNSISWVKSPSVYPVSQGYVQCVTLNNGKILAATGYPNVRNCYLGTVTGNDITWTVATAYPAPGVYTNCLVKLQDGRCLSLCGISYDGVISNKCYVTSATGSGWTAVTNYPLSVYSACACVLPNGKILVVGGYTGSVAEARCYIGTITGNTIAWKATSNYPLGGLHGGQAGIIGNKVVIVGGYNNNEGWATTASIGTYTAATNSLVWSVTNRHGLSNFVDNQLALTNISPTQLLAVGGDYNGRMTTPVDTVHIFELQKAYVRI